MNIDEWEQNYQPLDNVLVEGGSWDNKMYETYGKELEYVLAQPTSHIWTWVDGEDGTYLLSGYHLVNRIGYLICEIEEPKAIGVQVDSYETVS